VVTTDHPRIYLAGPITANKKEHRTIKSNVKDAMDLWHILAELGFYPYCPHLSYYLNTKCFSLQTYEDGLRHDFVWIKVCDAVYRMPGASKGADREVVFATEQEIPVYYDIDQMLDAFEL
jgi:hypothetical protein